MNDPYDSPAVLYYDELLAIADRHARNATEILPRGHPSASVHATLAVAYAVMALTQATVGMGTEGGQ